MGRLAGEAIMRGAHLFVPGMLAVSAGVSRGDLVAVAVRGWPGQDQLPACACWARTISATCAAPCSD